MKNSLTIPIAIALGGIIIAGALYVSMPKTSRTDTGDSALVRPVSASDHILGNPAAPVLIVEYSDFDCTYCKDFHETLHQIIANEGASGKVAWVFREFPLSELHPNAVAHARAAECVAKTAGNDAFWKFATTLFKNQPVDPMRYSALASSIGITGDAFAACYASAATSVDARITADRQNAFDIGAEGTPYSLILVKGKTPVIMNGGYPYAAVQELVRQALEKAQ
ncbi:MAG: thioredoxin domain-containing protein [Candidatus Kaiserbacteria bacterium]|nr:thioredoxin domain-containing protein [Candidatus Kaiserbacteria bacterium]